MASKEKLRKKIALLEAEIRELEMEAEEAAETILMLKDDCNSLEMASAESYALVLNHESHIESMEVELTKLRDRVDRAEKESREVRAQNIAFVAAIEEFAEWPGVPDIDFGAILLDPVTMETKRWAIRPGQLQGVADAILKYTEELLPYGVGAIKSLDKVNRLERSVRNFIMAAKGLVYDEQ